MSLSTSIPDKYNIEMNSYRVKKQKSVLRKDNFLLFAFSLPFRLLRICFNYAPFVFTQQSSNLDVSIQFLCHQSCIHLLALNPYFKHIYG